MKSTIRSNARSICLPRHPAVAYLRFFNHMHPFFLTAVIIAVTARCSCAADTDLKHILALLGTLRTGDHYATVQKHLPNVGALHADAGDDNTEALTQEKLGVVTLRGEFNFSRGRLVSHGFDTGNITHAQGHDLFLRCAKLLIELYGPAERSFLLPSEDDEPGDTLAIGMQWRLNGEQFSITLNYRPKTAAVSWGAQSESPTE